MEGELNVYSNGGTGGSGQHGEMVEVETMAPSSAPAITVSTI